MVLPEACDWAARLDERGYHQVVCTRKMLLSQFYCCHQKRLLQPRHVCPAASAALHLPHVLSILLILATLPIAAAATSGDNNTMVLSVGYGHTGTNSLASAFEALGLQTAHATPLTMSLMDLAVPGSQPIPWEELSHFQVLLDDPINEFWPEVLKRFPHARIILTTRDPTTWADSLLHWIGGELGCKNKTKTFPPTLNTYRKLAIRRFSFGTECPTRQQAIKRFVRHNEWVRATAPRARLLVMDITQGDGYNKLCPWLQAQHISTPTACQPDQSFPRQNQAKGRPGTKSS